MSSGLSEESSDSFVSSIEKLIRRHAAKVSPSNLFASALTHFGVPGHLLSPPQGNRLLLTSFFWIFLIKFLFVAALRVFVCDADAGEEAEAMPMGISNPMMSQEDFIKEAAKLLGWGAVDPSNVKGTIQPKNARLLSVSLLREGDVISLARKDQHPSEQLWAINCILLIPLLLS